MKKLFLLSFVLIAISGLAGAAPLTSTCAVLMFSNSSAPGSICTVTADAGFTITTLTLSYASYND